MGWQPVAAVRLQFTHKQYTKYKEQNTHRKAKEKVKWEVRAVPRLCELYPDICLTTEGKAGKNLS